MSSPLRVGFVGTGIFAKDVHLPLVQSSPEQFQASAAFNRTKAKAEEFAELASIPSSKVFESLDDLINSPEVDFIDALLPVEYNLETITKAVQAGKPIIIEKPIAATLDQAREIVKLTDTSDVPVAIAEQFLFFKAIDVIGEKLPLIGDIISFTYRSTGPFNTKNKYLNTSWRRNPNHIGGFLSDGGVHQLALLTEILGGLKFESISALTKQVRQESGTDDILFSTVQAERGIIGTFTYGSAFGAVEKHGSLVIFGTKGSIIFDFSAGKPNTVTLQLGEDSDGQDITVVQVNEDKPPGIEREFQDLHNAIVKKDKSLLKSSPRKNFHFLAIIDAALKSSKANGTAFKVEEP